MPGPNDLPEQTDAADNARSKQFPTRRGFILLSLGVLTGCATEQSVSTLPSPAWRSTYVPTYQPTPADTAPTGTQVSPAAETEAVAALPDHVLARSNWTRARPVYSRMVRMKPVEYITVHHDAHEGYLTAQKDVAKRLEAIRLYHKDVRGWGDIGYHFAVDRAGRVWEGRPMAWQGAHVKDCNEGNVGVMLLGNFDKQSPSSAQLASLNQHVTWLMQRYNVPISRVRTHREWAPTACPGKTVQQHMDQARKNHELG